MPKRKLILKEHVAIESNVEKFFKKLDWFKRYKTLQYNLFLKIVTKWCEFQKSKLNNFLTNRPFKKVFSHMILLRHVLSKSLIFLGISSNVIFAVNPVTSFSRQKPLKSRNQNHTNICISKFYHPANFEIKRIKTQKVFWNMAHLGAIIAKRGTTYDSHVSKRKNLKHMIYRSFSYV